MSDDTAPDYGKDFNGKVALVTGAASGIGLATAQCFAQRGAAVVLADINLKAVQQVSDELREAGANTFAVHVDVSDESSVAAMVASAAANAGEIDVAVNSAGTSDLPVKLVDMSLEQWDRMISINLTSIFLCMKHQLKHFHQRNEQAQKSCAIVNISSGAGMTPAPGQIHYTAAKHGIIGATRYAAQEQSKNGIRINTVCPGFTDTPLIKASLPEKMIEAAVPMLPQGRMGKAEEIAAAAVMLCSAQASWVNGQALVVDGGQLFH